MNKFYPLELIIIQTCVHFRGHPVYLAQGNTANKLVAEPELKPGLSSLNPTLLTTTFH